MRAGAACNACSCNIVKSAPQSAGAHDDARSSSSGGGGGSSGGREGVTISSVFVGLKNSTEKQFTKKSGDVPKRPLPQEGHTSHKTQKERGGGDDNNKHNTVMVFGA